MSLGDRFTKTTWWQRLLGITPPPTRIGAAPATRAVSARLPSGRATKDGGDGLIPGLLVMAPPAAYDESWRLLQADRRLIERLSPQRILEVLADLSPEVSRALWDFLRLCNPGWEATALRPGTDTQDEAAQAALDAFLATLDDLHGSVDVVFGRLYMGAFLRGALFAEVVLDGRGRAPVDLVTPDPASARFRRVTDPVRGPIWQLGQWQGTQFVPLDRPTVRYTPVDPFPSSPYGRPLAAPALFISLFLLAMLHDIRRVVQQQGYPRLDLSIDTEKMAEMLNAYADDPTAYQAQVQSLVDQVIRAYSDLEPDDAYVHTDVVTVNRPVGAVDASSLGAVDQLIAALERISTRALKSMPIMMGLSESNTETQANRQWEIQAAGIKSIQHYCETLLERLLTLALEAQGIQATVEFRFAELRAAEQLRDAQVETMLIQNAAAKRDQGWITQDEASEEVTGKPAAAPAPVVAPAQPEAQQDDNDGAEALNQASDRAIQGIRATRVKLIPDGADEPLVPVPDAITISDSDMDRAVNEWDALMPDYAGLLEATVVGQDEFGEEERSAAGMRAAGDPSPWVWSPSAHRYRDPSTGRFVGQRQMTELRDRFTDTKRSVAGDLAGQLAKGEISIQEFELRFRREIKTVFVDQYVLGKGGRSAMTASDWGAVGRMVRDQYEFAHRFAADIAAGKLSQAQIAARAALYVDAGTLSFERGRAASYGMPPLPDYPASGNQQCRTNCRCSWSIVETETEWRCTWTLTPGGETCPDCAANAGRWNPLVLPKAGRSRADLERELERMRNGNHAHA